MAFEDYLGRIGYNKSFLDSAAPAGAAAATPATGSQPDLTNRLLQIMSGQLGGTLSGGEKLSALGALLKSVSRGSQTSPQDVMRDIQKQKMAEVQGALQLQELRKAAAEKAQTDALKAEYVSQLGQSNPQLARAIALMSPEKFSDFVIQQNKAQGPAANAYEWFAKAYGEGTPEYNQAVKAYIERQNTFSGAGGAIYTEQPITLPDLPTKQTRVAGTPSRAEVLAELAKRGVKING